MYRGRDVGSYQAWTGRAVRACACAAGLLGWLAAGCGDAGDGLAREAISGMVTLDGKPLPRGAIQFVPNSQPATPAMAEIVAGRYAVERSRGLVAGTYKVLVSSPVETTPAAKSEMPGLAGPPPKERIPERYNSASMLSAEVKEGSPNSFDFALTSK